jgi:anti-sigma B factor antagonist
VEVDLSRLRIVDSSGVGALVSLYKRLRAQGGEMVVSGLQNQPLAIFRLLRLDRVMSGGGVG